MFVCVCISLLVCAFGVWMLLQSSLSSSDRASSYILCHLFWFFCMCLVSRELVACVFLFCFVFGLLPISLYPSIFTCFFRWLADSLVSWFLWINWMPFGWCLHSTSHKTMLLVSFFCWLYLVHLYILIRRYGVMRCAWLDLAWLGIFHSSTQLHQSFSTNRLICHRLNCFGCIKMSTASARIGCAHPSTLRSEWISF